MDTIIILMFIIFLGAALLLFVGFCLFFFNKTREFAVKMMIVCVVSLIISGGVCIVIEGM